MEELKTKILEAYDSYVDKLSPQSLDSQKIFTWSFQTCECEILKRAMRLDTDFKKDEFCRKVIEHHNIKEEEVVKWKDVVVTF